jgi:hypothetical protein
VNRLLLRWLWLLWLGLSAGGLEAQVIRLRTETIATPEPPAAALRALAARQAVEPAVSGLFLLQFTNRLESAWRAELRLRGVELVHFVPDDAFVVRLENVRLAAVQALPFVRWAGAFLPRHKIHPRLVAAFRQNVGTNLTVKLLARPSASGLELALVQRHLQAASRRTTLSLGTFFEGRLNAAELRVLAQSSAVLWIEPATRMKLVDEVSTTIVAGEADEIGGPAYVHQLGYDGSGVIVSVADSGIDSGDPDDIHPDLEGRVEALFAYDNLADASDEHSHGTHVAGIVLGSGASGEKDESGYLYGLGVAPGARLVGQRIFDGSGSYRPPPSFTRLTQDAVRSGAYVGSNSWGDDSAGQYNLDAAQFDALVRDADPDVPGEQPYILEFSAGNAGPAGQTIGTPAVAKNVIASGATQNNRFEFPIYGEGQEVMADFSSRGPAEDGRIKPDVVAPGTWIASLRSVFANDNNAWGPISDLYLYQGGTSQSGPHVSGACAVIVQWYRETHGGATPSPALVKAMLINSADDMGTAVIPGGDDVLGGEPTDDGDGILVGDTAPVPNNDEGWGRVNLVNLIDSERRFDFVEQGAGLATAQTFERKVVVGAGDQLKVTLVYTDVPGLPAAIPALVNDLDLEVIAPNGDRYRGNAFADGESVFGTFEGDRINNVEAVHLGEPAAGEWTIRVRGQNVVQDVHRSTTGAPTQDFALVISGQLPLPGEGVVSWDREAYRAPATATIRLVDQQLSAQATVTVTVTSPTESAGLVVTLNRVNGVNFAGTVSLTTNAPAANDGMLSVRDTDELTVVYQDASPPGERRATAVVDAQPPLISDVRAITEFGRVRIEWLNSELANATVFYGTTNAVTNIVSDPAFRLQSRVTLPPLEPGLTYFFYVAATDKAGNSTTNNNGGVFLRFTAPSPASALLVYSPEATFEELTDTTYPGIENWTAALDALSVDYEVWDTSVAGRAPTADELRPYRLVVWRPEEAGTLVPGMTTAVQNYVQAGGSLFVVSHDLLTRLTETPGGSNFMTQVLRVKSFTADSGATSIAAIPGDIAGAGVTVDLDYSNFPEGFVVDLLFSLNGLSGWSDVPDHLTPGDDAAPVFLEETQQIVGVRYPKTGQDSATGRVVFYSFPFEAVPLDTPAPNNRPTLLANALRFLTPELSPGGAVAFDQSAYTVPSDVVIEVLDSGRAGQGQVSVTVANGAAQQTIELAETPRRSVFRGRLSLQAPGQPAAPGRLAAVHGDQLRVTYVDVANAESSSVAFVDTVKAVISEVTTEPAYNEAIVYWLTDKPTDALVRFGESGGDDSFLTRSAYTAELAFEHGVLIKGLLPDKTYYFQVVSRDAAGNVTTAKNGNEFFTVRTLQPLSAPWEDPLDGRQPGWAVYNDDGGTGASLPGEEDDEGGGEFSSTGWQFGTPLNTRGITARTGTNVWATNLKGEGVDFAFSDLISPAISLVGGNKATLRFWQNYDFSITGGGEDDPFGDFVLEAGQVAVSTDNGATWQDVYFIPDEFSFDWEEVEVDLTKFVGQVIRLRFNYQLFAFSTSDRLGWLLDDVAIEMNTVASTEVMVTNNLEQATFTLNGPTNLVVAGAGALFRTNLPAGEYRITWNRVPFHQTPPAQTNTLGASTNRLVFTGNYTFADANTNGISDSWETVFFREVRVGYTGADDSDFDGAVDFDEWRAGTNPTDNDSRLLLDPPTTQENGTVLLEWSTTLNRVYALEVSNDLVEWTRVSDFLRADGDFLGASLPSLDPRLPYFFRVIVYP